MRFEADHYYHASLERIEQARTLYGQGSAYALAMYVAGVSVECMLRAFKLRRRSTFDERHDLLRLFQASGMLETDPAVLEKVGLSLAETAGYQRGLQAAAETVHHLWANDYRFASESRMRAHLKRLQLGRRIKGDVLKANAKRLLDASTSFINKGVLSWTPS